MKYRLPKLPLWSTAAFAAIGVGWFLTDLWDPRTTYFIGMMAALFVVAVATLEEAHRGDE